MLTDKEKNAAADLLLVGADLTEGELTDESTGLFNDGLGAFLKFALRRELFATEAEVKLTTKERRKIKKDMNALIKSFKDQLHRAIDEEF